MQKFEQEFEILLTKLALLMPAFIAVMLKLAVEAKRNKLKIFNAFVSVFVGVGTAYLSSPFILKHTSNETYPIIIGFVAISSDKFFEWFLMKIKDMKVFDIALKPIIEYFESFFKK